MSAKRRSSIALHFLVSEIQDAAGFVKRQYDTRNGIKAIFDGATAQEQVVAGQLGFTIDATAVVLSCNYYGEHMFTDEATGETYDIKNTAIEGMNTRLSGQRREHGEI